MSHWRETLPEVPRTPRLEHDTYTHAVELVAAAQTGRLLVMPSITLVLAARTSCTIPALDVTAKVPYAGQALPVNLVGLSGAFSAPTHLANGDQLELVFGLPFLVRLP